jgi:hypothetical protein
VDNTAWIIVAVFSPKDSYGLWTEEKIYTDIREARKNDIGLGIINGFIIIDSVEGRHLEGEHHFYNTVTEAVEILDKLR